jgi:hypothetical protein
VRVKHLRYAFCNALRNVSFTGSTPNTLRIKLSGTNAAAAAAAVAAAADDDEVKRSRLVENDRNGTTPLVESDTARLES